MSSWLRLILSKAPSRLADVLSWSVSREEINQILPVVNVVPLTSRKSPKRTIYPNEVLFPAGTAGLPVDSIALCYQIRTLDKKRLLKDFGGITNPMLQSEIRESLRFQLQM